MAEKHEQPSGAAGGISVRTAEVVVALVLLALGALVIFDSYRLGFRWGIEGPEAGYFPFYIGVVIAISGGVILAQTLLGHARKPNAIFVEWQALRQVLAVLIPAALFIVGIEVIGLYVAAAIYIAGFMIWLGKYSWLKGVLLGVGVSAVAFVTFEVWFKVPLYKGAFDPLSFLGY